MLLEGSCKDARRSSNGFLRPCCSVYVGTVEILGPFGVSTVRLCSPRCLGTWEGAGLGG